MAKIFRGPDEDAEHYATPEHKQNVRDGAKAFRTYPDGEFSGEPVEIAQRRTKFNRLRAKVTSQIENEHFKTLEQSVQRFQSPSCVVHCSNSNVDPDPLSWEINNDDVLANNKLGCCLKLYLRSGAGCIVHELSDTSTLYNVWWLFKHPPFDIDEAIVLGPPNDWETKLRGTISSAPKPDESDWYQLTIDTKSFATMEKISREEAESLWAGSTSQRLPQSS